MIRRLVSLLGAIAPVVSSAQPSERVQSAVRVSGVVFVDRNGNGARDAGEPGLGNVAVSDQATVATTDSAGRFTLDAAGYGVVFVTQPNGYLVHGPFWRKAEAGREVTFPVTLAGAAAGFSFIHASDTHIANESVPRVRRLKALVDSLRPAFLLISGDLVRDALRVTETEARGYYDLLLRELQTFTVPVYTVPGNHEIFGIERHRSLVSPTHPMYGKRMYRSLLGPDYYSFEFGGIHFMGLNTVDYDDLWYYGHVDSLQLDWIKRDVARLPREMPVVTFNHIPFVSASPIIDGYDESSVAPSVIRVRGRAAFRHTVQNVTDVMNALGERLQIALGGHTHQHEILRFEMAGGQRRFAQAAAVVGPVRSEGPLGIRSGITFYRVTNRRVDEGTFVPLDRP
ncbi:MAG TPA: metallophosphoesterase [Gemmatimonadaceae bacterium]|nr:metallophosphoesterase [Gemmatimonadaceae bacterium]